MGDENLEKLKMEGTDNTKVAMKEESVNPAPTLDTKPINGGPAPTPDAKPMDDGPVLPGDAGKTTEIKEMKPPIWVRMSADELMKIGRAPIKMKFIHPSALVPRKRKAETEASGEAENPPKKSRRGQNKKRQRYKNKGMKMCKAIALGQSCFYGDRCKFTHDIKAFMAQKPEDIDIECPEHSLTGKCRFGLKCRMAKSHIDEDFKQIVVERSAELQAKFKLPVNFLPGKSAGMLKRRGKYPFKSSSRVSKSYDKYLARNKNKPSAPTQVAEKITSTPATTTNTPTATTITDTLPTTASTTTTSTETAATSLATTTTVTTTIASTDTDTKTITTATTTTDAATTITDAATTTTDAATTTTDAATTTTDAATTTIDAATTTIDAATTTDAGTTTTTATPPSAPIASSTTTPEQNNPTPTPTPTTQPVVKEADLKGSNAFDTLCSDIDRLIPLEPKKLDLKGKLYLAPLTTVGNLPFRRVCKAFGCDVTCSEMALTSSLCRGQQSEWALLKRHPEEDIYGIQIAGSQVTTIARACELINEYCETDFVDLNAGCPIDQVCYKGMGSALMPKKTKLWSCLRSMTSTLDCATTVKMRIGWNENDINAHDIVSNLRACGVSAATIHGRTRRQRYTKLANWDYLQRCGAEADVDIIGNGDIYNYEDYYKQMESGKLSTAMIARGALIKPWIFTEIKERKHWDISSSERFDIMKKFVNYGLEHWGSDQQGVDRTRRFLLEWLSFTCRYIPIGLMEVQKYDMNLKPPRLVGRDDMETLLSSRFADDWVKLTEMLLGPVPDGYIFTPKHKANSYDPDSSYG